jgi:hypothetical protein
MMKVDEYAEILKSGGPEHYPIDNTRDALMKKIDKLEES